MAEKSAEGVVSLLLDSVILIDHLNGVEAASRYLQETKSQAAISVITRAEVLSGVDFAARPQVLRLLDAYEALHIDRETADLAAELRREHRWRLPDAFQAALAKIYGLKLVTRNTRDFPAGKFDFVIVPYRVSI